MNAQQFPFGRITAVAAALHRPGRRDVHRHFGCRLSRHNNATVVRAGVNKQHISGPGRFGSVLQTVAAATYLYDTSVPGNLGHRARGDFERSGLAAAVRVAQRHAQLIPRSRT